MQHSAKKAGVKSRLSTNISNDGAYSVAFDWITKNLYVGNHLSACIELYRTTVNPALRTVVLPNDNPESGVVFPVSVVLDPNQG